MKIAFVDNLGSGGGLSRFCYKLCESLLAADPLVSISYYANEGNLTRTPEFNALKSDRFKIILLKTTIDKPVSLLQRIANRVARLAGMGPDNIRSGNETIKEIEKVVTDCDLAYFPVAHMMQKPDLAVPMVGTIHDFNWKYFFGQQIFPLAYVRDMDVYIQDWLNQVHTVSSSHDVVHELEKLYPHSRRKPEVIPIAPVVISENVSSQEAQRILEELKIDYPYIIFPGNFFPHKNHLNLFAAFSLLRKRKGFEKYKLLLTGVNSDQIPYAIAGRTGIQIVTENSPNKDFDIHGLGYQSNRVIEVLIKNARLLVSPSIYEAICTPAMDAWFLGTPTAISNIPPFKEHETAWGIRSAFFDPMDINDIADTIERYLNDPEKTKSDAILSKQQIAKYTWEIVADKYLEVFRTAVKEGSVQ